VGEVEDWLGNELLAVQLLSWYVQISLHICLVQVKLVGLDLLVFFLGLVTLECFDSGYVCLLGRQLIHTA
jgi:hypothetical protein